MKKKITQTKKLNAFQKAKNKIKKKNGKFILIFNFNFFCLKFKMLIFFGWTKAFSLITNS